MVTFDKILAMSGKPWYQDWFNSPFYHKLYFERNREEAESFINKLIDHLKPTGTPFVLDVACGRGRHSQFLAKKGFIVTGIDLSPASIAYAKQFEHDNLEFFQHDMRLPFRVNYYDYAFSFFTSFGYFSTRRDHDDAVRTMAHSLKENGLLVMDYLNVHYAEDHLVYDEEKTIDSTVFSIRRWHDESHFYKRIRVMDSSLLQPVEFTEKVAKFNLGDFTDMFAFQNMQVQEIFGDYNLDPYDVRKTPRLIMVVRKGS